MNELIYKELNRLNNNLESLKSAIENLTLTSYPVLGISKNGIKWEERKPVEIEIPCFDKDGKQSISHYIINK